MRAHEFLVEAAPPAIGRKYQHVEDLVFTNGSHGGLHAVERLRHMATEGGTIELKWDGSPVIYWGRDDNGRFSMMTKNAWDYLKRGKTQLDGGVSTVMRGPKDVESFILGTGRPATTPEDQQQREAYAARISQLWPYFESASPTRGYLEGGLLFYPGEPAVLNTKHDDYEFKPNITMFHIPAKSDLGQRIAKAKVMVAATGYYESLGSSEETRYPDAETLSKPEIIVQGTTYVQEAPKVKTKGLDKIEKYIEKNAHLIDNFLAPKPGLGKPGDILYRFFNQNLRAAGVKAKFQQWATDNLSEPQSKKVLADPGLDVILTAVEMLTQVKLDIINVLSSMAHGDIRQTRPEGYVQAHPGAKFKRDLPGQFIKAIDQANWAPRKD